MEITGAMMSLLFLPMAGAFGVEEGELQELEQEMAQFGENVPSEIAEDFEVLAGAFDSFLIELEGLDLDGGMGVFDPEVAERMEAAAEDLESPEVEAAGENVENFLEQHCDFEDMGMDMGLDMDPEDLGIGL